MEWTVLAGACLTEAVILELALKVGSDYLSVQDGRTVWEIWAETHIHQTAGYRLVIRSLRSL